MCKIIRRSMSIILVLALVFQLLPLSCFAADAVDSEEMIGDVTLPEVEEIPSVTETETETEEEEEPPQIVEEDMSKRDEYYKEFILDNGQRLATIYPTAVHYQKDNRWEEIDNTLIATLSNGASVYTNSAGPWSVHFPQQLSGSNAISITKDGYTVSFAMSGELTSGSGLAVASIDATATAELSVATAKTSMAQLQSVDTTSLKAPRPIS